MLATKTRPGIGFRPFSVSAPLIKQAAGDAQSFEDSLATIGRSFLAPKAPTLFKHEIGFQVLDSDDDNSRAVGVFGFRIGKRLFYVPVFYRDGVFKGTEQLRDPKRKTAVPLSDNWVNKYMFEQGDTKPKVISRASMRDSAQPSLWQLKYPPTKYAFAPLDPESAKDIRRDLAGAIGRDMPAADRAPAFDLMKLAAEHPAVLETIGDWSTAYTWLGDAVLKFHGAAKIASAISEAEAKIAAKIDLFDSVADPRIVPLPTTVKKAVESTVTVIRVSQVGLRRVGRPGGPKVEALYDPSEWEDLRSGRNNYKDNRGPDVKSKVTLWVGGDLPDGETLANPSENGVYEVLSAGHKYRRCAVLVPLTGPAPSIGRCLVVDVENGEWAYRHPNAVWVRGQADEGELGKWVDSLKKVGEGAEGVPTDKTCAAVARVTAAEHGGAFAATIPFRSDEDGEAYFWGNPEESRPFWAPFDPWKDRTDLFLSKSQRDYRAPTIHDSSRDDKSGCRVEVFDEASRPKMYGNQLYLPKGCHLIDLSGKRFQCADGSDPERVLFSRNYGDNDKKASISKVDSGWELFDPRSERTLKYADVNDLEADLVESHGLDVPTAKQAAFQATKRSTVEFMVKYADGYKEATPVPTHLMPAQKPIPAAQSPGLASVVGTAFSGAPRWGAEIGPGSVPLTPGVEKKIPEIAPKAAPLDDGLIGGGLFQPAKVAAEVPMPDTGLAMNFPSSPALPFDLVSAPASFADDIVPSETASSMRVPVDDMLMRAGAMDRYRPYPIDHGVEGGTGGIGNSGDPSRMGPLSEDLEAVASAASSGRRDLFDTASLAALVKHKRIDSLLRETSRHLGAAVTSLADDLCHMYWNTDEWAERYGEGEIGPLEDQMLSQFEKLGDLVLRLQENSSRSGPDMSIIPEIAPSDNSEQGD